MNILIIGSNNPMAYELSKYLTSLSHNVFSISSTNKDSKNTYVLDMSKKLSEKMILDKISPLKKRYLDVLLYFQQRVQITRIPLNYCQLTFRYMKT